MATIDITDLVQMPPNEEQIIVRNGDTMDIVKVIQKMDAFCASKSFLARFAPLLKGDTRIETMENVFNCAKINFSYKIDESGFEQIKSSAWMAYYRIGDCKSYSIFIGDCLRELKIPFHFRFVSFEKSNSTPTHVFVVVKEKGNGKEFILDAISKHLGFNDEARGITYSSDIKGKV